MKETNKPGTIAPAAVTSDGVNSHHQNRTSPVRVYVQFQYGDESDVKPSFAISVRGNIELFDLTIHEIVELRRQIDRALTCEGITPKTE